MDIVKLKTQPRPALGKRAALKVRRQGLIPAIIYGHKQDPVPVALAQDVLDSALRHHARLVELETSKGTETALIKEIQHDHLGKAVLHVDFERVDRDEKIIIQVPLELKGTAPGASSGVLDQPLHELKVECLAAQVPESIKVNISALQLGQVIHVKDVPLPPGVRVLTDPEAIVIQVKAHVVMAEPAPGAAPAEGAAEPEIVGRRVKAEEPEEK
jgi:large subunit ribosomal protein L25